MGCREDSREGGVLEGVTIQKVVEKVYALIEADPQITQRKLMDQTGLIRRGIEWNLKKLKESGRLKRIGPDKGGHWVIMK